MRGLYDKYIQKRLDAGEPRSRYADYLDYSIGFTTRGCFRKCDFCVNRKYNKVFTHSPVSEFYDPARPNIYLWDDNFMASPDFDKILDELIATGRKFQFRQGLDMRLMTEKKAERLSKVKYHGDYIFAFDHIEDKDLISRKLKIWRKYCRKSTKLYVLVGHDSQDERDIENTFERIKILMEHGCLPYIMRYEDYKTSKFRSMYVQLQYFTTFRFPRQNQSPLHSLFLTQNLIIARHNSTKTPRHPSTRSKQEIPPSKTREPQLSITA